MFVQAQDDPQDIAYEACYDTSGYEFNTDTGVIESYNYANDYYNSQTCEWFINPSGGIPDDQVGTVKSFLSLKPVVLGYSPHKYQMYTVWLLRGV